LTVFFDYSPEIRRVIYTTNAIESLNYSLRKLLKTRGAFPNDDAIVKILYLAINRVAKKWTMPIRDWKAALNQFVILFGDRQFMGTSYIPPVKPILLIYDYAVLRISPIFGNTPPEGFQVFSSADSLA
jgi:hypothetical protein